MSLGTTPGRDQGTSEARTVMLTSNGTGERVSYQAPAFNVLQLNGSVRSAEHGAGKPWSQ